MKKTPLKKYKGLNRISPKQAELDAKWRAIAGIKARDLHSICQWCGHFMWPHTFVGHHIIKRSHGRIDEPSNCYVCHRICHSEITNNNVDVNQYPNREVWNRRG